MKINMLIVKDNGPSLLTKRPKNELPLNVVYTAEHYTIHHPGNCEICGCRIDFGDAPDEEDEEP